MRNVFALSVRKGLLIVGNASGIVLHLSGRFALLWGLTAILLAATPLPGIGTSFLIGPEGMGSVKLAEARRTGWVRTEMIVTAYTAGHESTGKRPGHPAYGITTSGHRIQVGAGERLAAAPEWLPFGAKVFVPGYGEGPILDRGEAIQGKRLDVYFDRVEDALEWGVKTMPVYILMGEQTDGR